jgi:protein gp37
LSERTNIEWADLTASPWFGCSKVSPGCTHCYAEELTLKRGWAGWGDKSPRVRSKGFWKDAYRWNERAVLVEKVAAFITAKPKHVTIKGTLQFNRPRIFTSLMDWLDPMAPIDWLADFLKVIHECENLDWLLLTKRPELWRERMDAVAKLWACDGSYWETPEARCYHDMICPWRAGEAPPQCWFGVSVENQAMADKRIPELLNIPANIRWLSVEPILEPINLQGIQFDKRRTMNVLEGCGIDERSMCQTIPNAHCDKIDWVVVGGESGARRRDCGVEAIVNVAEQCKAAGVPVFVKQDVGLRPGQQGRIPDQYWSLKQFPK